MTVADRPPRRPWALCLILLLAGGYLVVAGAMLAVEGGSSYYLPAGVAVAATVMLRRRDGRSDLLYGIFLAATLLWSVWEAGTDAWALMPRIAGPALLGLWSILPGIRSTSTP